MTKLCFSCFKRIPIFAGKCPYCLDQHQGMYGRIIIGILIVVGFLFFASSYEKKEFSINDIPQTTTIELTDNELLKELRNDP